MDYTLPKRAELTAQHFTEWTILEIDPLQTEQLILHIMPGTHYHRYFIKSKLLISRESNTLGKRNNAPPATDVR